MTKPTSQPLAIAQLLAQIKTEADQIEHTLQADLAQATQGDDPLLVEILGYALLNGGKRMRPLLAMTAARLCGESGTPACYQIALAFEYLHVATLIHDDVIDNAGKRRGKISLVKAYGIGAAILAGDWLHARAMDLVGQLAGQAGLTIFCQATQDMVNGEFLQIRHTGQIKLAETDYFEVIRCKTAELIKATCAIGGLFAGGTEQQIKALSTYGLRLGTAFQVIDDILDYQGDSKQTGKQLGTDFLEGKITLPLIYTLSRSTGTTYTDLTQRLSKTDKTAADFQTVCDHMSTADGFNASFQQAQQLSQQAVDALSCFTAEETRSPKALLSDLAQYVIQRRQ